MKLFRRDSKNCDSNNAVSPEVEPSVEEKTEPVAPPKKNSAYTPKKGYATPRRRDVERARGIQRGPVAPAPMTRKEARAREDAHYAGMTKEEKKAAKAREREERRMQQEYRRERMAAGDDDYVLPRDKGPVRRFARDWVDSNWTPISWLFPVVLFLLIFTMIPNYSIQRFVQYLMYFCFIVLLVETFRICITVSHRAEKEFPNKGKKETGFRLGWYAFMRATQPRHWRNPVPQTAPVFPWSKSTDGEETDTSAPASEEEKPSRKKNTD